MALRMRENWRQYFVLAVVFVAVGLFLGRTDLGDHLADLGVQVKERVLRSVVEKTDLDTITLLFAEHPKLIKAIKRGGSFGGKYSRAIAQSMFTRSGLGVHDAKNLMEVG